MRYSVGIDLANGNGDKSCITYFRTDPNGYKWLVEQQFPETKRFLKLRIWWTILKLKWKYRNSWTAKE